MTLGTGDFIAKLKRDWSDEGHGKLVEPHQLTDSEMAHLWEVKNIQYEDGGKKLTVELEEVE